jgi:hypothetical protein
VRLATLDHLAAIRIERVVDDPLRRVVLMVVPEAEMPEAFGDGFEAGSLRLIVQCVIGIGAVDDPPEQYQRRIAGQLVLFQDRLERAFLAVMAELDVLDVVGNGVEALRLPPSPSPGTNTNSASLSTNFLMSHGHATRSTLTFSRVIHFILRLLCSSSGVRENEYPAMRG